MSYPPGTSDQYAIPTLRLADSDIGTANASIATTTKAFLGDLDCERGSLSTFEIPRNVSSSMLGPDISLQSPSCQVGRTAWPENDGFSLTGGGGEYFFFGTNFLLNCSNATSDLERTRLVVAAGSKNSTTGPASCYQVPTMSQSTSANPKIIFWTPMSSSTRPDPCYTLIPQYQAISLE